ncbi:MAG: diaminopimelate epimerase [Planctomycetes bacterium]|nr:diaminopimelate epimerase [Planctomycetota bacterium]MCB9872055.1 diaminopimelate epimerase [Planctomycetota bacterium]MCB9889778.1 diaminopimelate epimerase [Planctomycetota bacterium]
MTPQESGRVGGPRALEFVKMHGAGNDYVFVDGIHGVFEPERGPEVARRLSDRHRGVGGDGLIVLARSELADVRMWMWNADGSRGSMCGNGLRCLAKLAHDVGVVGGPLVVVETDAGVRRVELLFEGQTVVGARADMGRIAVDPQPSRVVAAGHTWELHHVDAGNPHAVVFTDQDPESLPVLEAGAALQQLAGVPGGVNVEFVRVEGDGGLRQRTFERGSGETLACGSGATAAACAAVLLGLVGGPRVEVRLRGGTLWIEPSDGGAVMEGPATEVFRGRVELA